MIFNYPIEFPADDCERLVPDPATARRLVNERRPELEALLVQRRTRFASITGGIKPQTLAAAEDAIRIAFCRLAYRHGSWGKDFHHYHNENHIFEILGSRLERLLDAIGIEALDVLDWFLLALFGAAHDLRQREIPVFEAGIGSNERASIEETFRILDVSGFSRTDHAGRLSQHRTDDRGQHVRCAPGAAGQGIQLGRDGDGVGRCARAETGQETR